MRQLARIVEPEEVLIRKSAVLFFHEMPKVPPSDLQPRLILIP